MAHTGVVVDPDGQLPTRYYGVRAIAARLGISTPTVMRWRIKRRLPVIAMGCSRKWCQRGWLWYTDESMLLRWSDIMALQALKEQVLPTKQAQAETVRARAIARRRPVPAEFALPGDEINPKSLPPK